jgi:NADH:ubiquinone oxidoreductase subunit D
LLIIAEPVSPKLVSAVVETVNALPRPAHVLLIGEPEAGLGHFPGIDLASLEGLLPGSSRVSQPMVQPVLETVLQAVHGPSLPVLNREEPEPPLILLPSRQEQEMATELVVLSLGPVQPFTAGPLRLFLICDGEQVLSTQVESGYAYRGIASAMTQVDWKTALNLARHLDPLAPVASQLTYVRAVEQLQHWQPPTRVERLREAAVALERAQNYLWWIVRFANILDDMQLIERAYNLASRFAGVHSSLWIQPPTSWILPQQCVSALPVVRAALSHVQQIADDVAALKKDIERNRWLALRTRHIGVLAVDVLKTAGVSGPVLQASEQGTGDVQSRVVTRLGATVTAIQRAAEALTRAETESAHEASWEVPVGEAMATVEGPRGVLGVYIVSSGGERPNQVQWQRPSASLLPLLPEILAGQKLVDAEVIIASLDLAIAEADG